MESPQNVSPGQQSTNPPLKRKRSSHGELRGPRAAGTYQRNKAPNACLVCRQRKTKCDNELPVCGFCKANGGDCQYAKPKELRYDQASIAILQRLETLESNITSIVKATAAESRNQNGSIVTQQPCDDTDVNSPPQVQRRQGAYVDGPVIRTPLGVSENDDQETESPPNSGALLRASSDMSIESMLRWPLFASRLRTSEEGTIPRLTGFPPNEELYVPHDHVDLRPHVVLPLVENFVANCLPSHPILNPELLRHKVNVVMHRGIQWDEDTCLVLLVLALGSLSRSVGETKPTHKIHVSKNDDEFKLAESYFWTAQHRLGLQYHQNHYVAAQLAFFTGVYFGFTMRIMAAWKAFAQAGTQCLAHLTATGVMDRAAAPSPGDSSTGSIGRQVLQDSLYWAILKGEAELCVELGLPASGLHECEYPHIYPQPPDLDEVPLGYQPPNGPEAHGRKHFVTGWFYYLGEIALRRLQNRVIRFRYAGNYPIVRWSQSNEAWFMEKLRDFDDQIDTWLHSLPASLKFDPASPTPLNDHLRWVLRVHRTDIIEILRFPAYHALIHLRAGATSQDLSAYTVQTIREFLTNAKLRIDLRAEKFLFRHQGSFLTIRNCTRSALGLIGAKLKCNEIDESNARAGQINATSPSHSFSDMILPYQWEQTVESVLNMLRVWETEDADIGCLRSVLENLFHTCLQNRGGVANPMSIANGMLVW